MPVVSTGQITIVDVNDGLDVNLSANSVVLAADTAGTVSSFAAAETTMSIREAGVVTTSTWAFYVSATGGGISYRDSDDTVDRTGTGAVSGQLTGTAGYVKVVALSQDLSFLDITATKGSQTVVRRFSVAKARQGATGGPGPTGPRGTITTSRAITGTAWSDAEANTAISDAGGGTPIQGDVVTLYNTGASFSATRARSSGGTWSPLTAFFGGDVIVDNTLAASKIVAGSISADRIAAGAVTASKIAVGDFTVQARNWNFEEGDAGWTKESGWAVISDATNAKSGTWVARNTNNAAGTALRNLQRVAVEPGETFYAEAYIKHAASSAGTGARVRCIGFNATLATEVQLAGGAYVPAATTAYTKSSVSFTVGAGVAFVDVEVESILTAGSTFADEVRLFRTSNTTLIANGAITTDKIGTGEVKAGNIFAGAVTTDKLDALAVTTAKIEAGAVTAAKVSAGAITTSKLLVVPASLCPDPYFSDEAWWTATQFEANGWYFESDTTMSVGKQASLWSGHPTNNPGAGRKHIWSGPVAVPSIGTWVRLRARMRNNSNQTFYVAARFYDRLNATLTDINLASAAGSGIQDLTLQGQVPANAVSVRFIIYNEANNTFSGAITASAVILDQAATADLIVDGAISAAKISAGAITTDKLLVTGQGTAINPDPNTTDISAWEGGTFSIVADVASPTGGALAVTSVGATTYTKRFALDASKNYDLRMSVRRVSGTATTYLLAAFFDANDALLQAGSYGAGWPYGGTYHYFGLAGTSAPTSYTEYRVSFGPNEAPQIPPGTKYARVGMLANYSGGAGEQRFTSIRLVEKATADLIVDGAITASKILAGAISTDKLLVTGRGKALNDDPFFQDASAWTNTGGGGSFALVTESTSPSGTKVLRATNDVQFSARQFPVVAGTRYKVTVWSRRTAGSGSMYLRLYCYNAAGALVNFEATKLDGSGTLENVVVPSAWTKYTGYVNAGAATVNGTLIVHVNWQTTGTTDVADCRVEEYIGGDLIVDGAITATKLSANAIAVGTAAIENGAIVNAMIGTGEIDNAKIANLDAAKINAGILDASRIGAASITANKIKVSSKGGLTILSDDPMFQDPTYWSLTSANVEFSSGTNASGAKGSTYVGSSTGTDEKITSGRYYEIDPTQTYRLSALLYRNGGDRNMYLFVEFYDHNYAYVGNGSTGWGGTMSGYTYGGVPPTIGVFQRLGGAFGPNTGREIPPNVRYCKIGGWFNYSGNGTTVVGQAIQDLRLDQYINGGSLIVDGSVTANQIDARGLSIKDASGNIILAAGTPLTSSNITPAQGWLNANLSFGTNLQYNSDFSNGLDGWALQDQYLITQNAFGLNLGTDWYLAPYNGAGTSVLYSRQDGTVNNQGGYYEWAGRAVPVQGGKRYAISAYTGAHRCLVTVFAYIYDASNNLVATAYSGSNVGNAEEKAGGKAISGYKRNYGVYDMPSNAAYAVIRLRKHDTYAGNSDSYMFVTRAQIEEVASGAAEPGPWIPSGYTDQTAVRAVNPVNSSNISTYIAGAAIGWAQIGDLNITTGGGVRSGKTAYGAGTGWLLEYNSGAPRFDIGTSDQYMRWDGSKLEVKAKTENFVRTGVADGASFAEGAYQMSTTATAYVQFRSNGTVYSKQNSAAYYLQGNWYDPTTTSIGNSYWVKFTKVSGSTPTGALGSWLQLNTDQTLSLSKAPTGAVSSTVQYQISTSSSGAPLVASGYVYLDAEAGT